MLDWKQRVADKCRQFGLTCEESGDGLLINGAFLKMTGIEILEEKHAKALDDLIDYRLYKLLPPVKWVTKG
jgi:5-enolpyruvylshikimate-3-phosphate synthase